MNLKSRRGIGSGIRRLVPVIAGVLLGASAVAHADTYTYNYVGPTFTGSTDHVAVTFTTSAPLAPSTSYLSAADAGVISGAVTVVGATGVVSGFTLPLSTFQVHTDATASIGIPGIDAWFVLGDASNLSGTSPTMTGTDFQSYTMNTMTFIPGSDIPGATGLVTGHYNYDQATETTFYASCTGIAGCTLAGNGQPYVGNYSGIINPANTSAANWTMAVNATTPPPPVACSGTDAAISGVNKWWLDINGGLSGGGQSVVYAPQSGTTFTGGTTAFLVGELVDYVGTVDGTGMCAATTMTVKPAPTPVSAYSCTKPAGAKTAQGKNRITAVGAGYIVVGSVTVQVPSCAVVSLNGATGFAVGQRAEYQGYKAGGVTVATQITIN
jgi:hypothetical protein